ncbi:hypothetical protein [Spirosoma linguale]|uniref:Uncharacterized protein n=1 Tax=Spirosoma linguale (strain ATCC 33905 / DSM 74 / LMG 10896 / Claus 1) TaxID=504472 RepID=D2QLE8_SPILD|nr:hypothetical protein Slin_3084 [Spirosoma linguale DSM 74]
MSETNKGGRPTKSIDWTVVEQMLKAGSSGGAVADFFGMNRDHFYRRVRQEKNVHLSLWQAQCKAFTRHSLRVAQIKEALGYEYEKTETIYETLPDGSRVAVGSRVTKLYHPPSASMLIFLGKNMLAQSDKPELNGNSEGVFGKVPHYRFVGDDDE